jgi:hypothetical protein
MSGSIATCDLATRREPQDAGLLVDTGKEHILRGAALSDAFPPAPDARHRSDSGMRLSTASANHSVEQILQPELNSIRQRMIYRIVWIGRHV